MNAAAARAEILPSWFRIAALLAILWNLFGVVMYLSSVGVFGDPTAGLSEADRAAAASIPPLVTGAFAIGTFAGLIGSVGLYLRKRWAWLSLLASLVALAILEGWILFVSDARESFGVALPVTILIVAALLFWLAHHARERGWLS